VGEEGISRLRQRHGATVASRTVHEERVNFPLPRELRVLAGQEARCRGKELVMSRRAPRQGKIKRLRCIHRKMSFAAFQRLPHRLGWKHEYYGGKAHITPGWITVKFQLALAPREPDQRRCLRPLNPADAAALEAPFLAAFAQAPEYVGYPAHRFKRTAGEYLERFFGTVRGEWSPVSVVAEVDDAIVGAALVKMQPNDALLDCIFVRPEYVRRGLATAMATRVVNALVKAGPSLLVSSAMLANEPSIAWHQHFGFHEVPDLWVASHRWRFYEYEIERHRGFKHVTEAELARLAEAAAHWLAEVQRLEALKKENFRSAHAGLE
jgi:ribosomal protein S18 acetylase RimI-like enzyme